MVGHTHNNLDQVFSTASIYQDKHSVFSFKHLIQSLSLAYKKKGSTPSGEFLPTVFNWAGFLGPFTKLMKGTSSPHVYLFRRLDEGKIGMKAKAWHSSGDVWKGGNSETDQWWIVMTDVPPGFPPKLLPDLLENYPDPRTVSVMENYMTEEQQAEWKYVQENNAVPDELQFVMPEFYNDPVQVL